MSAPMTPVDLPRHVDSLLLGLRPGVELAMAALWEHVRESIDVRVGQAIEAAVESTWSASPWLNVAQAAEYLGCTERRIYDLTSSRQLAVYKDGRRSLYRRDDLDALIHPTRGAWPHRGPRQGKPA